MADSDGFAPRLSIRRTGFPACRFGGTLQTPVGPMGWRATSTSRLERLACEVHGPFDGFVHRLHGPVFQSGTRAGGEPSRDARFCASDFRFRRCANGFRSSVFEFGKSVSAPRGCANPLHNSVLRLHGLVGALHTCARRKRDCATAPHNAVPVVHSSVFAGRNLVTGWHNRQTQRRDCEIEERDGERRGRERGGGGGARISDRRTGRTAGSVFLGISDSSPRRALDLKEVLEHSPARFRPRAQHACRLPSFPLGFGPLWKIICRPHWNQRHRQERRGRPRFLRPRRSSAPNRCRPARAGAWGG